jgi:hypothetical protein
MENIGRLSRVVEGLLGDPEARFRGYPSDVNFGMSKSSQPRQLEVQALAGTCT